MVQPKKVVTSSSSNEKKKQTTAASVRAGRGRSGGGVGSKVEGGIERINKPSIRRLARRAGVTRLGANIYDATNDEAQKLLRKVLCDASAATELGGRRKITNHDMAIALQKNGRFGEVPHL